MVKRENKNVFITRLSHHLRKQRIGLMAGSFNPAHQAHKEIAEVAKKQAKLSEIWWLVSPKNPLKSDINMMPFEHRLLSAIMVANNVPWLKVLDYEHQLQITNCFPNKRASTIITLSRLRLQFPLTSFIWIMGAANLIQFFQWKDAHRIAKLVDIFVMNRPDFTFKALSSKSVAILGSRCPPSHLGTGRKRKWAFSFSTRNTLSATKIRKNMPN